MWMLRVMLVAGLILTGSESAGAAEAFDHAHRQLSVVLQQSVRAGRVDYARLRQDRRALDAYRAQLANVVEVALASWPRGQQLAFWINAYNASVLTTIVDNYPIGRGSVIGLAFPANSIWQVSGAFKAKRHRVASRLRSLDEIEHEILRPQLQEPRIHMALVCAARGCPPLRDEPYVNAQLDQQLDQQTRRFLADSTHGLRWQAESRRLETSSIFKWFASDFEVGGGVRAFLAAYVTDARISAALHDPANKLRYLSYDWTLNDL
jgi:hypothetical protein